MKKYVQLEREITTKSFLQHRYSFVNFLINIFLLFIKENIFLRKIKKIILIIPRHANTVTLNIGTIESDTDNTSIWLKLIIYFNWTVFWFALTVTDANLLCHSLDWFGKLNEIDNAGSITDVI